MISCDAYKNGRCLGTKEVDPCNCDGDKVKCSFYENVRKQGRELEKTYESNRIKNAIASYYLDHMNDDERCPWCTNANGKTDLDFSIIDDNFGQYVHQRMIKFCPFCGRRLWNECNQKEDIN